MNQVLLEFFSREIIIGAFGANISLSLHTFIYVLAVTLKYICFMPGSSAACISVVWPCACDGFECGAEL